MELYGFTPRMISMGSAGTAISRDSAACFYNPAGLSMTDTSNIMIGYFYSQANMNIDRYKALESYNQQTIDNVFNVENGGINGNPDDLQDALVELKKLKQHEVYPPEYMGLVLGFCASPEITGHIIGLGFALFIPPDGIYYSQGIDPMTPNFYRYQFYPNRMVINLGIGLRFPFGIWGVPENEILTEFALGFGIDIFSNMQGSAYLSPNYVTDESLFLKEMVVADRRVEYKLPFTLYPKAGILIEFIDMIAIGAAYRHETYHKFILPTKTITVMQVPFIGTQYASIIQSTESTPFWTPMQIAIGLAFDIKEPLDDFIYSLLISLEITYDRWQDAPDPSFICTVYQGNDLLGEDMNAPSTTNVIDMGFKDTWTPRFGFEFALHQLAKWLDQLAMRLGYFYRPTPIPVPNKGGTENDIVFAPLNGTEEYYGFLSNYIDSDTHGISLGVGIGSDFFDFFSAPITLDIAAQVSILEELKTNKVDHLGNPIDNATAFIGNYSASGQIWVVNVSLTYNWK